MIYLVKYEDGPCAWNIGEIEIEAKNESLAREKMLIMIPKAMIVSVEILFKKQ